MLRGRGPRFLHARRFSARNLERARGRFLPALWLLNIALLLLENPLLLLLLHHLLPLLLLGLPLLLHLVLLHLPLLLHLLLLLLPFHAAIDLGLIEIPLILPP